MGEEPERHADQDQRASGDLHLALDLDRLVPDFFNRKARGGPSIDAAFEHQRRAVHGAGQPLAGSGREGGGDSRRDLLSTRNDPRP